MAYVKEIKAIDFQIFKCDSILILLTILLIHYHFYPVFYSFRVIVLQSFFFIYTYKTNFLKLKILNSAKLCDRHKYIVENIPKPDRSPPTQKNLFKAKKNIFFNDMFHNSLTV